MGRALPSTQSNWRFDRAGRERLSILLFLLASSIFLFADTKVPPVALQDEARNAINAIEMYLRGPSLVTTFNFQPDLWNTKPPLFIWLMSGSMALFGPSDWALRLPSALAALGILCCTLVFVRRITGSLATGIAAASILVLSPGFFGEHGARTADFDATLAFFVTAGLQLLFFAVHRVRPNLGSMFAIGGLIAAGALTKSIAAFIPVSGVLLYLVVVGRFGRALTAWQRYAVAGTVALAPLLVFYALREMAGPGYIAAVLYNDLAGRFSETLIRPTSPFYYVKELSFGWFVAGPFLIAAPLAAARCSGRTRLLFVYAASIAGVSLLVYSAASNRAVQYALPVLPWLSIMAALTLLHLFQFLAKTWQEGKKGQTVVLGLTLALIGGQLIYRAAEWRFERFPARQFYAQSSYGDLFAELWARGVHEVTVIDPGKIHLGKPGYTPLLRWNRLIWEEKGMTIQHELERHDRMQGPLASCEPLVFNRWRGPTVEKIGECAVLWSPAGSGRSRPQG